MTSAAQGASASHWLDKRALTASSEALASATLEMRRFCKQPFLATSDVQIKAWLGAIAPKGFQETCAPGLEFLRVCYGRLCIKLDAEDHVAGLPSIYAHVAKTPANKK